MTSSVNVARVKVHIPLVPSSMTSSMTSPEMTSTNLYCDESILVLELNFVETWGDLSYLGLTGLQLFDTNGEIIHVSLEMMQVGAMFIFRAIIDTQK